MTLLILFLAIAAGLQVAIFLYSRSLKKQSKKDDVLLKYDIKSRSELFAALNRTDIPEEDLNKLNDIYTRLA